MCVCTTPASPAVHLSACAWELVCLMRSGFNEAIGEPDEPALLQATGPRARRPPRQAGRPCLLLRLNREPLSPRPWLLFLSVPTIQPAACVLFQCRVTLQRPIFHSSLVLSCLSCSCAWKECIAPGFSISLSLAFKHASPGFPTPHLHPP